MRDAVAEEDPAPAPAVKVAARVLILRALKTIRSSNTTFYLAAPESMAGFFSCSQLSSLQAPAAGSATTKTCCWQRKAAASHIILTGGQLSPP